MKQAISLIIPFRNRSIDRLSNVVRSFREQYDGDLSDLEVVVSDYGSTSPSHLELSQFCRQNRCVHVTSYAEGLPWSRAHAINNGARAASSEWLCIADVDMVLMDPVFGYIRSRLDKNIVWFLESIWPQSPKQNYRKGVINRSYGVFQIVHKDWFVNLHGFDERMEFWGGEDFDWIRRIERKGGVKAWLPATDFRLVHTWHAWENNPINRPTNAVWKTLELEYCNIALELHNPGWGLPLTANERPILNHMQTPHEAIGVGENRYQEQFASLVDMLYQGNLVKIDLGERGQQRRLSSLSAYVGFLSRPLEAFGLKMVPMVNYNFENFLVSRAALANVLADYFIEDNMRFVWLLGRRS